MRGQGGDSEGVEGVVHSTQQSGHFIKSNTEDGSVRGRTVEVKNDDVREDMKGNREGCSCVTILVTGDLETSLSLCTFTSRSVSYIVIG